VVFTNQACKESGTWKGNCGHGAITVTQGERFPDCPGCRRGIDWHLVTPLHDLRPSGPRQGDADDWSDEGWWPGKGPG